jgi:hypothetical protein
MRMRMIVATVVAMLSVAACTTAPSGSGGAGTGGPGQRSVDPRLTDPALPSEFLFTNIAQSAGGTARNKLVLVFHGTSANPQAHTELVNALSGDGYHVAAVRYNAVLSATGGCPDVTQDEDPDCHQHLRAETVFGQGVADPEGQASDHPLLNITRTNSAMNRALKLVNYLAATYPAEGWGQYLQRGAGGGCTSFNATYGTCNLDWAKVVLMGHSQGGSVALYTSSFYPVSRVGMLSGAYDAWDNGDGTLTTANWVVARKSKIPVAKVVEFVHTRDVGLARIRAVERSLGINGPEKNVLTSARPWGFSQSLVTTITPTCPLDASQAHNATAQDLCAPDGQFVPVWRYMAGGA